MRHRAIVLAVLLVAAGGCSADTLELFVDVQAGLAPGVEFDRVVTGLYTDETLPAVQRTEVSATPSEDYIAGRRVAELSSISPGSYVVRVSLELGGSEVRTRSLFLALTATRAVTFAFDTPCSGTGCPVNDGGPPDAPATVPDGAPTCASAADCDDTSPCTVDTCTAAGVCTYAPATNGTPCADVFFCNGLEACSAGVCVHSGNPCGLPEDCDEMRDWCSCSDGNECTVNDHYDETGACVGTVSGASCTTCGGAACGCCDGRCERFDQDSQCGRCDRGCSGVDYCEDCGSSGFCCR